MSADTLLFALPLTLVILTSLGLLLASLLRPTHRRRLLVWA